VRWPAQVPDPILIDVVAAGEAGDAALRLQLVPDRCDVRELGPELLGHVVSVAIPVQRPRSVGNRPCTNVSLVQALTPCPSLCVCPLFLQIQGFLDVGKVVLTPSSVYVQKPTQFCCLIATFL
jgi:hypothetical protein